MNRKAANPLSSLRKIFPEAKDHPQDDEDYDSDAEAPSQPSNAKRVLAAVGFVVVLAILIKVRRS